MSIVKEQSRRAADQVFQASGRRNDVCIPGLILHLVRGRGSGSKTRVLGKRNFVAAFCLWG